MPIHAFTQQVGHLRSAIECLSFDFPSPHSGLFLARLADNAGLLLRRAREDGLPQWRLTKLDLAHQHLRHALERGDAKYRLALADLLLEQVA